MKNLKKIMIMGFVLLIVTISKPVMALELGSFTDVPNFSVVIGDSMYTLEYANDLNNASLINEAVVKNKGDIFIKTDDNGWIKNSNGTLVSKGSVDISTVKYNNGQKIVASVPVTSNVTKIQVNPNIKNTGTNTATFTYKILDQTGLDITKIILASQINAIASVSSTVVLDPLTATGTITYNSITDIGTSINVTLTDKINGATINVVMLTPIVKTDAPKVNKIIVTSTELRTSGGIGYALYSIYDQYGNDVTNTPLGTKVTFSSNIGQVISSNGSLTITANAGIKYSMLNSVAITGSDSITGVSMTATLSVTIAGSTQIGTLSNIILTTLTNVDGKILTAGDTSDVFYAGYVAIDVNGKLTTNYDLMAQGLILTGDHMLTTSTPNVVAQLVRDPSDEAKGLIKVTATSDTIVVDMPVVILAITASKTSQMTTTLKKQSAVDSFTLQYPSESISSGQSVLIPFTALDQNGKIITNFSELDGLITLTGATLKKNLDGTASLMSNKVYNTGTISTYTVITAVTRTGKHSSITINIQ
ncbi:hypothetical protein [Clostridium estertheticum]|uniref:hypothetical protein n=1 Tax=Clostridium estertheticum TaxID=238834 RepID=UPI001C7DE2F5|nr:hypothetical protein [Clostridium estertheticum]MBX4264106.1 hypothetical protein [Clostridium estertheticum]WLC87209.1 hypothetical protein KTC95_13685 [Clostridium estertheticum]